MALVYFNAVAKNLSKNLESSMENIKSIDQLDLSISYSKITYRLFNRFFNIFKQSFRITEKYDDFKGLISVLTGDFSILRN